MLLRVDKRVGMWGYGNFWITFADKYPISVDLDRLQPETRDKIIQCLNRGVLFEVDETDNRIVRQVTTPIVIQRPVVTVPDEASAQSEIVLPVAQKLAIIQLLETGVRQIKVAISENNNILQLMFAVEHEKANKKRSTVLSILTKRLEQLAPKSSLTQRINPYEAMIVDDEPEVIKVNMADLVVVQTTEVPDQSTEEQDLDEEMV